MEWRRILYCRLLQYSIISKALSRFSLFKPRKLLGHNDKLFELQKRDFFTSKSLKNILEQLYWMYYHELMLGVRLNVTLIN